MRELTIGSMFSGYGGLDEGVRLALQRAGIPTRVLFHAEIDSAPSKVLAHHWPAVPNLGDVTKVDWERTVNAGHVGVLTAGFPCQDVSLAGRRLGLREGTRSGLWSEVVRAVVALRPELVVIENVRGLLSAPAGATDDEWDEELADEDARDLEHLEGSVGEIFGRDRPVLRALGVVLGDLADLGYDTAWCGVRAADAGAPHGRFRIFVVAFPEHADGGRCEAYERVGEGADAARRDDTRGTGAEPVGLGSGGSAPADAPGARNADLAEVDGDEPAVVGSEPGAGGGVVAGDPASGVRVVGRGAREIRAAASGDSADLISERGRPVRGERPGDEGSAGGAGSPAAQDTDLAAGGERRVAASGQAEGRGARSDARRRGGAPAAGEDAAADTVRGPAKRRRGRAAVAGQARAPRSEGGPADEVGDAAADSGAAAADPEGGRRGLRSATHNGETSGDVDAPGDQGALHGARSGGVRGEAAVIDWGTYEPAIRRWERITGRVAPPPTVADGLHQQHRLSAEFVEWMMGLQVGHVTAPEIGLSRNEQLKALGNGVVPQQAALAVAALLERIAS